MRLSLRTGFLGTALVFAAIVFLTTAFVFAVVFLRVAALLTAFLLDGLFAVFFIGLIFLPTGFFVLA